MYTLNVILIVATIIYMLIYQPGFYKFYFGILIPYYIISQLFFGDKKLNSSKKKFFMSSWYHPFDSQIYCSSTVDVTKLLSFIKNYNTEHNTNIGITIFIMKLLANLFVKYPDLNGNIIFGDVLKKDRIDVSITLSSDEGHNNEVITVQNANNLSLEKIKKEVDNHIEAIKNGFDVNLGMQKFFINLLATFILSPFLRIISTLSASGVNLSILGLPKYSYGTAVICNYGKDGLEDTFLPLFPFSYSPICVGISKIKEYNPYKYEKRPKDKNKKFFKCKFYYTIDHRYLNERIVAKLLKDINNTILDPKKVFDQVYFSECSDISSTEIEPVSKIRMHFENHMKENFLN